MTNGVKMMNMFAIKRGIIWVGSLLLLLAIAVSVNAQGSASSTTPPALTPGTPFGSYSLSGLDSVNLFNGNLNFHVPLLKVGGRGDAQASIMLKIEERWRVEQVTSCSPCGPVNYATYNWWTGYQVGYGPGILEARVSDSGFQEDPNGNPWPQTSLLRLTFTMPDGTELELRDPGSNGQPKSVDASLNPPGGERFYLRGSVFRTSDGTSATFVSCQPNGTLIPLYDDTFTGISAPYPSGYLLFRDGMRYRIDGGLVQWIEDRNGNRVTFSYNHTDAFGQPDGRVTSIVDSLNRQVTIAYDTNGGATFGTCDVITYSGFGGASRTIHISKGVLGSALRSDVPRTRNYSFLFPTIPGNSPMRFNPTVITAVWLPDGTSFYKLYYNEYGELARVELPGGGAMEYDWGVGVNNAPTGGVLYGGGSIYRRLLERRVYPNGGTGTTYESRTTYSVPETLSSPGGITNLGYVDVKDYGAGPLPLLMNRHYFYGSASFDPATMNVADYTPWKFGKEYKTESLNSSSSPVQREEQTFSQQSPTWWIGSADDAPENNPQLTDTKSTWVLTSQVSKQHFGYDAYNNTILTEEYDYGISNPPSFPIRRTETDYVTTNESNNIDYTGTGIEADVTHRPYLRSLPKEKRVYTVNPSSGTRTLYNSTHFYYDQTAAQNLAGIVGHDAIYDTSYNKRGNLTSTTRPLDGGGTLTTSAQYDIAGHAIQTTDGRGNTSLVGYAVSSNTYAFATSVSTAAPDLTGAHGSTARLVTLYDFDVASGLLKSITEPNQQPTTAVYNNDPFDRLAGITLPVGGGQTTFSYGDTPGNLYVQTQQQQDASTTRTSTTRFDGMGRAVRTEQSEGGGSIIYSDTTYGDLGRVIQASNPYRTGDTVRYTSTAYDDLGRVHIVTLPGGAQTVTDYLGNATTVTDPAGKATKKLTDGLGRTSQVIEDPGSTPHLNYQTTCLYDVLDNLRQVTQGVGGTPQNRYYMYDSLGRLVRASNPEQEINASLPAMTDPLTGRSQWSMGFTYDNNNNMLTRTDPRNVICNYTYDALNRVTNRSYANNINQTPGVDFYYDGVGVSPAPLYALGHLTKVAASSTSGFSSSNTCDSFDRLGRVTHTTQTTDNQPYGMGYQYDLAGHLIWEQYPSNRIVTTAYDQAGRLSDVSSGATDYASQFTYAAHGGITDLKLGNNLWEHTQYDHVETSPNRIQPTTIAVGTAKGSSNIFKLDYDYGTLTANNGNVASQTLTLPGTAALAQSYIYDGVNRLQTAKEMQGATTLWQQSFNYDAFGNRSMNLAATTGGYVGANPQASSATNRIVPQGGELYDYDKAGNLTHDGAGHRFDYDTENRQVKYDTTVGQYFYDGSGHRVKSVVNGVTTVYVYDAGGHLVAEYGSATGSGTSYITADALGTPRLITGTNASAPVKSRHDYLPFGEEINTNVGGRTAALGYAADNLRQKFTGKERDQESGLDYFASRYYASAMGRFMSADSVAGSPGNPQTMNLYAYVLNNPLGGIDPSGHKDISVSDYDGTNDKIEQLTEQNAAQEKQRQRHARLEAALQAAPSLTQGQELGGDPCRRPLQFHEHMEVYGHTAEQQQIVPQSSTISPLSGASVLAPPLGGLLTGGEVGAAMAAECTPLGIALSGTGLVIYGLGEYIEDPRQPSAIAADGSISCTAGWQCYPDHITLELPRVIPMGIPAELDKKCWEESQACMKWAEGAVDPAEVDRRLRQCGNAWADCLHGRIPIWPHLPGGGWIH